MNADMDALKYAHLNYKLHRLLDRVTLACERISKQRAKRASSKEEIEGWVREQRMFLEQISWELCEQAPNYLGQKIPDGVLEAYLKD